MQRHRHAPDGGSSFIIYDVGNTPGQGSSTGLRWKGSANTAYAGEGESGNLQPYQVSNYIIKS